VAGVPPDYFSPEGQLWGNPLYDWEADGIFDWWVERVKHDLEMFDILRIDHFRGLESYWAVPFGDKTAMNGSWKPARAYELLNRLKEEVGLENIIAEDLGIITHAVEKLRDDFQLPGMKILQFAFTAGYESTYLPHRINKNSVIFTGTHDNDTTRGWHDSEERSKADKKFATDYLNCNDADITKAMIRAAWASRAKIAIAPMQDFLNLGTEARINTPGVLGDNWQWRMHKAALSDKLSAEIKHITELYFR
jgi:4-alpha-glucanotransferase